jgi:uncharacterized membrane protein YbhN (UPF0104 family)
LLYQRIPVRMTEQLPDTTDAKLEAAEAESTPERDAHRLRNGVIWTAVLALLLLGIGLAVPDLRGVLSTASNASVGWLVLGVALEVGSCLGYVLVVRVVLHRGPPREIRRLAWAEQAFGAVVGAGGAGGLAVGAWAMRAWGASWSRVANRSGVIFLLTSAVNAAVLGLAGLGVWLGVGSDRTGPLYGLLPGAIALAGLALFLVFPRVKAPSEGRARARRLRLALHGLGIWVRDTESVALQPNWRLIGAPAYLLCDIAVLWACLRAVGVNPPILALVLGYQIGYLANVIPVPGGIGVLEGGLLAALVLYHLPVTQTAAAVILYHAIALWVPTIGGTVGFARLRRSIADRSWTIAKAASEGASPDTVAGEATVPAIGAGPEPSSLAA